MNPEEIEQAAAKFCFRPPDSDEKAGPDDYLACTLAPHHPGDCIYANASWFRNRLRRESRVAT